MSYNEIEISESKSQELEDLTTSSFTNNNTRSKTISIKVEFPPSRKKIIEVDVKPAEWQRYIKQ